MDCHEGQWNACCVKQAFFVLRTGRYGQDGDADAGHGFGSEGDFFVERIPVCIRIYPAAE